MIVSELAKLAGVTPETVRHYTRSGLLTPNKQNANGYHYYGETDLKRLIFVRKARLLGFTVSEIAQILNMSECGRSPCPKVRTIIKERLKETQEKIKELKSLQVSMERASKKWAEMPDGTPDGHAVCHLIEMLGS